MRSFPELMQTTQANTQPPPSVVLRASDIPPGPMSQHPGGRHCSRSASLKDRAWGRGGSLTAQLRQGARTQPQAVVKQKATLLTTLLHHLLPGHGDLTSATILLHNRPQETNRDSTHRWVCKREIHVTIYRLENVWADSWKNSTQHWAVGKGRVSPTRLRRGASGGNVNSWAVKLNTTGSVHQRAGGSTNSTKDGPAS